MHRALCLLLLALLPASQGANKVIFISFDGFRYDYMDLAKLAGRDVSALERVRDNGFQADVQNVMLTLTFPSHYAMATGRTVENHGLVGNNFHDPETNESYSYTDSYSNIEPKWFEYAGAEPIWVTNERHGRRSCVFQWIGSEARVQGKLPFASAGVYNSRYSLQYRIDRILDWISRDEFNLAMLYYNEPDSAGHRYGPESNEVLDKIEEVNDGVEYLLQRIEQTPSLKGKVNVIISSDHGMTEVDVKERVIDLYKVLGGSDALLDSSPATLGLWPNGTADNITALFELINGTAHLDVYYREDIPDRYHFKKNPRIAPVFAIAELGYLISTRSSGYTNLNGMHGYDNQQPDMHPFMVAMGPDIVKLSERQIFYQVDFYPLICAILGLDKPNRIDGLIDRVLPFLKTQPSEQYLKNFRLYASGTLVH